MFNVNNNESFIEEVSEELRKDKLTKFVKKYVWIVVVAILTIIFIIGYNEYRKVSTSKINQNNTDIIYDFINANNDSSLNKLKNLASTNEINSIVPKFLLSRKYILDNEIQKAKEILISIQNIKDVPIEFSDLAKLYIYFIEEENNKKKDLIEELNSPNSPFRLSSLEQKVYIYVNENEFSKANDLIELILNDIELTNSLKQRMKNIQKVIGSKL